MFKIIPRRRENKLHATIFFSHILMVVVAIIITSAILFMSFQTILMGKIYETQEEQLQNASYSMDNTFANIKALALQLYFDSDISKLRNLTEPGLDDINTASARLSMYGSTIPYIQSLYIYSDISKKYYVSIPNGLNRIFEMGKFYDNDIKEIIQTTGQNDILHPISREVPLFYSNSGVSRSKGFSFLYCKADMRDIGSEGAVVINVSETWVRKMIGKYNSQAGNHTFVIDGKGNVIVDDGENESAKDLSKACIDRILSSQNKYGYFTDVTDNGRSLVVYTVYEPFDWVFIRVIPFQNIMSEINSIRDRTLLISLAMLITGCIIAVLISKRVVLPVDKILAQLSILEAEKSNTVNERKKEYLKEMILGKNEDLQEKACFNIRILDADLEPVGKYVMLYLVIDHFDAFCSEYSVKDRNLLKFAIINIAMELSSEYFKNEGVDLGEDGIAIILNIPEQLEGTYHNNLETLIRNIQTSTKKAISIQISVIVSLIGDGYSSLPVLFNEAKNLSLDRFFYGHECILFCNALRKKEYAQYSYPVETEKRLVDALLEGNIQGVKECYDDIVQDSLQYSYYTMRLTVLRMASSMSSALNTIEKNLGVSFSYNFEQFVSKLDRMESLDEMNGFFIQFFDSISETMERKRNLKHQEILEQILNIVENDYASDLSLDIIAERLNMSPSYLGRLFSKLSSKSIVDYINEIRIRNAKEMLAKSNKAVNDICSSTGFTNIQHFYRVFKRFTGVTPSEYRNHQSKAEF